MQSIFDLSINFDVDYVRRHKHQLQHFFDDFQKKVAEEIKEPLLAYKVTADDFDDVGTLWVNKKDLDAKSLRLIQLIERSYMSMSFFSETPRQLGARGYVYYSSAIEDEDKMRAVLRLINQTNNSIEALLELYPHYQSRWEFGIYALLDDIRYKLLILDECYETFSLEGPELLDKIVNFFYDYLQGTMPSVDAVEDFCHTVNQVLVTVIHAPVPSRIRTYKEADNPLENLRFRDTLIAKLKATPIDTIIGIRFGGSELPHLVKKYIPGADVVKVRASNYSEVSQDVSIDGLRKDAENILILDDNILTGRTLQSLIAALKRTSVKRAYFGCVSYSAMKRYPQMIMPDHGVVNMDVLRWSCVVAESQYTRISNSRSYKNSNGVFDKVKAALQRRMNDEGLRYKL